MKYIEENINQELNEEFLVETLNLNNKNILELGCGDASKTKAIASNGFDRSVTACEVDELQHEKNLKLNIKNIDFILCAAQNLPFEDNSFDIVFLFKSFHHIPIAFMTKALKEIKRVLKPNGLVYISEPLYSGELNEIISLFHDERIVRKEAFDAIKESIDNQEFKLFKEIFFYSIVTYKDFEDFKSKMMYVTYNKNDISPELEQIVKDRFLHYSKAKEISFKKPFRVDILQKIST